MHIKFLLIFLCLFHQTFGYATWYVSQWFGPFKSNAGPSPREGSAAVESVTPEIAYSVDSGSYRYRNGLYSTVMFFGGKDDSNYYNDLWQYSAQGENWYALDADAIVKPPPRAFSKITGLDYESAILFGGKDATTFFDDTWLFSSSWSSYSNTWTLLPRNASDPVGRIGHLMIPRFYREGIWLFGGQTQNGTYLNDLYTINTTSGWTPLTFSGQGPSPRSNAGGSRIFLENGNKALIIFGGFNGSFLSDAYLLQDNVWKVLPSAPFSRSSPFVFQDNYLLFVFGGQSDSGSMTDVWQFNTQEKTWNLWSIFRGQPPPPISNYGIIDSSEVVLFGGKNEDGSYSSDVWVFDPIHTIYDVPFSGAFGGALAAILVIISLSVISSCIFGICTRNSL